MDKTDRLKDAVVKGNKSRFIHCIHNFSEEDIIGLTYQEFEEILECCTKIKLDEIKEFFVFLFEEGKQALENSEIRIKVKENAITARFYLSLFRKKSN